MVSRKIKNVIPLIILGIACGVLSSIVGNLVVQFFTVGPIGETMNRILGGLFSHPVLVLVTALIYRQRLAKVMELEVDNFERERRRQMALSAQKDLEENKQKNI